jgi:hypothetical protein
MNSIIESAYFATLMLGPGLLKKSKGKSLKIKKGISKNKNASVENFLRGILGTRLIQPAIISSAHKEIKRRA